MAMDAVDQDYLTEMLASGSKEMAEDKTEVAVKNVELTHDQLMVSRLYSKSVFIHQNFTYQPNLIML